MKVSVVRMAIDRVRKDPRSVIIAIDSLLPLTAIMHDVAHFSALLSERALAVRPAGSV
jgi:hypothetical protein